MTLDGQTILLLAVTAHRDPTTVRRYLRGERVHRGTVALIVDAARRLNIALPASDSAAA